MAKRAGRSTNEDDIPAIALLTQNTHNIKDIKDPPEEYTAIVKYREKTEEVFKKAMKTTREVNQYAVRINKENEKLKAALREATARVNDVMQKLIEKFQQQHMPSRNNAQLNMPPTKRSAPHIHSSNEDESTTRTATRVKEVRSRANRSSDVSTIVHTEPPVQSGLEMKCLNELLEMNKMRMELEEAITQTQIMVDKMKNNVEYTNEDFKALSGHIKNLQSTEHNMIEQDKKRKRQEEDEKRRREQEKREKQQQKLEEEREKRRLEEEEKQRLKEEERQRKLEEERLRQEEKRQEEVEKRRREQEKREKREREQQQKLEEKREKMRLEEEEKLRLEEEERQRKLEEEILRQEEEERIRQEEEERLRQEEEERRKQEEEEKRRREEEARQRRLEEEARRKREKEKRLAAEQKEKERRRRIDPENWEPIFYERDDSVDREISISHHQGVCCVVTAVQDGLSEDDLQCLSSDDVDDIVDALDDGDKVVSSVVSITTKYVRINLEAPMRVFLPHQSINDRNEDIRLKVSVNGGGWTAVEPIQLPSRLLLEQNVQLVGVELNDFDMVKIVAVANGRSQSFMVDESGTRMGDNRVQVFVPSDTFTESTELKLSVDPIPDDVLHTIASGSDFIGTVIKGGPLVTLETPTMPAKQIEIDIMTASDSFGRGGKDQPQLKSKTHALVKSKKGAWQFADVDYKNKSKVRTISLPTANSSYRLLELEVTPSMSAEDVKRRAEEVYEYMTRSAVRVIVKQKESHPEQVMVHCVGRKAVLNRLEEMEQLGYTLGPDTSGEFHISDGQRLKIFCSGNIEPSLKDRKCTILPFFAYIDTAKLEFMIKVKDQYKQRDLPQHVGNIHCQVLPQGIAEDDNNTTCEMDIQLPVSLPKGTGKSLHLKTVPVRLPHYWCSLATFLSWKLTDSNIKERGIDWCSVLSDLTGNPSKMKHQLSRAKTKTSEAGGEMELCNVMLEDWMKTTNVNDDKLGPVIMALRNFGLKELAEDSVKFVEYHRDKMGDAIMRGWAEKLGSDIQSLAAQLCVSPSIVEACIAVNPGDVANQVTSLLMQWRSSFVAVEMGTSAIGFLGSLEL